MNLLKLSSSELKESLRNGKIVTAIYGLGRIGMPLAAAWLRAGAKVIGVDIREDWVKQLNSGDFSFPDEPQLVPIISEYLKKGLFRATTNGVKASRNSHVKIVAVPTLIKDNGEPELSALKSALKTIGEGLKEGDLVIIESSVPPKTTEKIAKPILEEVSGLKAEEQFALAFSPERVMVGRALQDIEEHYPKIVGGIGPKSTEIAATLYECIARRGVIRLSSATAAELSKLFEGIYRDVNIALANELAKLCMKMGLDFMEIRRASNSQPYCHLHIPGCGVGGACIPIYPKYVLHIAEKYGVKLPLTEMARSINEQMPKQTVNLLMEALEQLNENIGNIKIAVLGAAFRGNTSDTRLSPTHQIIQILKKLGASNIIVHDPYVKSDQKLIQLNVKLTNNLKEAVANAKAIIIATDHDEYKERALSELIEHASRPIIVIDGRNIYVNQELPENTIYISISGRKVSKLTKP